MAGANSTLSKVPFWVVHHLGNKVELVREHVDFMRTYPAGSLATLDGVTVSGDEIVAVVTFDVDDDPSYLLHVPFDLLCMPGQGEGSATRLRELCAGLHGRVVDVVHLWAMGFDPKDRVPSSSYYRYRDQLRSYGIDIAKPFSEALRRSKESAAAGTGELCERGADGVLMA